MLLCTKNNTDYLKTIFGSVTEKLYQKSNDDIILFTKNLLMEIEPWKPEWEQRLRKSMNDYDNTVNKLYGIVVGY
jgi:hypothetical protein